MDITEHILFYKSHVKGKYGSMDITKTGIKRE
jgi:hypothetical protein